MPTINIHGPDAGAYTARPPITADVSYSSVRRSGDKIYCDVSLSINGISGIRYFGYNLDMYAQLDDGPLVGICSKGNSPSQWSSGEFSGAGTASSNNRTTSCTLKILTSSICGCHAGAPALVVWSTTLSAPSADFTVNFYDHTGSTLLKTQKVAPGGNATPPSHPNRPGYTPNGWSGDYKNVTSNRTCKALYTQNRYLVRYNLNGGDTDLTFLPQVQLGGETLILNNTTPTYTINITLDGNGGVGETITLHRRFLGWKCSANDLIYQPGSPYSINANCIMVAQWETVSYDVSSQSPVSDKQSILTVNWMDKVTTIKTEVRTHRFLGWFTNPVAGSHVTSVELSNSVTYYAHWEDALILPVQITPNKANWNLVGYFLDSIYTPSRRITTATTMSESITIYVKWSYNVYMNGNGGCLWLSTFPQSDGVIPNKLVDVLIKQHGVPLVFPDYVMDFLTSSESSADGGDQDTSSKDFVNWNSRANGSGVSYPKIYTYNIDDSATFYAQWKTKIFTVTFRDGYRSGDAGLIATFKVPYGGSVKKSDVAALGIPKRKGYSFSGWKGSYTNVRSDVTVVAVWNFSPIWIFVSDGLGSGYWKGYEPKE